MVASLEHSAAAAAIAGESSPPPEAGTMHSLVLLLPRGVRFTGEAEAMVARREKRPNARMFVLKSVSVSGCCAGEAKLLRLMGFWGRPLAPFYPAGEPPIRCSCRSLSPPPPSQRSQGALRTRRAGGSP